MGRPPNPRLGLWSAKPKPLRKTQRNVPGWWCPFVAVPLLCETFGGHDLPGAMVASMLFGGALLVALTLYWNVAEFLALRATPADRAFSDAPPGLVEFRVETVLYDGNGPIGVDRGIVWIEDGILTFNGAACSFALAAEDFHRRGAAKRGRDVPSDALRLRTPGKTAYVRFVPLHAPRGMAFPYWLGRFLASVDQSDRPRQWPPLRPYGAPEPASMPTGTPEALGAKAARTGSSIGIVRVKRTDGPSSDRNPLNAKRL